MMNSFTLRCASSARSNARWPRISPWRLKRFAPFGIRVAGVGRFDHHKRGALWAGVEPRAPLAALAAKVERICAGVGLPPERRAFHPHVTLARWGRGPGNTFEPFLATHAALRSAEFSIDSVTLYESHLSQGGAAYTAIARYPLDHKAWTPI